MKKLFCIIQTTGCDNYEVYSRSAKYWGDRFLADILYVQEFLGQTLGTPCTSKKIFEGGRLDKKGRH